MSYRRESPCMKYYEKAKGDALIRKSLSATRFPPIRRTSDPSSDDSDDFHQLDIGEDQSSSISRSSSESCHSLGSNRCQLRKLDEMRSSRSSLNKMQVFDDDFLYKNESLDEFRSRLRIRRSIKARDKSQKEWSYQENEGDRSDFSCDSTTKEAHEEILRNAESLRQEQAENFSTTSKKTIRTYKPLVRGTKVEKRIDFADNHQNKVGNIEGILDSSDSLQNKEETLERLCGRRQEELRLSSLTNRQSLDYGEDRTPMHGLQRSSTDYFGQVSDESQSKSLSVKAKRIFSSPRLRRKTQTSQVLRAASSIPSLIFPLKSSKNKSLNTIDVLDSSNSNTPDSFGGSKKSSIDEGLVCTTPKTRRSPLRFLGNFVDDKILRGRWGSTKRAKSSVELGRLAWEMPDEVTDSAAKQKLNRRKSSSNKEDKDQSNKEVVPIARKTSPDRQTDSSAVSPKSSTSSILKRKPRSLSTCVTDRNRGRLPSATSDRLSLSSSSAIGSDEADIFLPQQPVRTEISADALAEIEAFERLAKSLLNESPSDK